MIFVLLLIMKKAGRPSEITAAVTSPGKKSLVARSPINAGTRAERTPKELMS